MIFNIKNNTLTPEKGCYLVRNIDRAKIFNTVYLGKWEINGVVYDLTIDNFKEYVK